MFFVRHLKSTTFIVVLMFSGPVFLVAYFSIPPFFGAARQVEAIVASDCSFRVIGHRGNSYTAPEDTAFSVNEAFQVGANMVEVDVRLSKEGIPVLMHDSLLDRTTNGSGPVKHWSVSMLKTLDAGSWKGGQFKNVKVTTLAEAILAAAGRGPLYLDIKVADLQQPIAKMLKDNNFPADSVYPAVNSNEMLLAYHKALPKTPLIWFHEIPQDWDASWLDYLIENGVVGLEIFWPTIQGRADGKKLIQMVQDKGLEFWTYTINDQNVMRDVIKANINGLETDLPSVLFDLVCGEGSGEGNGGNGRLNRIVGHWDFNRANLEAGIGSNLRHWGEIPDKEQQIKFADASKFALPLPGGKETKVLYLPGYDRRQGLQLAPGLHHFGAGSGRRINQYSLVFDLLRPSESENTKQALLQSNWRNRNQAEIYINKDGSIGNVVSAVGKSEINVWFRLVIVVDLLASSDGRIDIYIDGIFQGYLPGDGVDGHFSVQSNISNRPLLLFTDIEGNSEPLYVAAIQLRDYVMSQKEVSDLGSVSKNGVLSYTPRRGVDILPGISAVP